MQWRSSILETQELRLLIARASNAGATTPLMCRAYSAEAIAMKVRGNEQAHQAMSNLVTDFLSSAGRQSLNVTKKRITHYSKYLEKDMLNASKIEFQARQAVLGAATNKDKKAEVLPETEQHHHSNAIKCDKITK
ncbi:hypothetical protein ACH5RR_014781 [Cinchona calisaya]|uniref:Uncharacterized protein n=1 Tax=Cinchona calisaya TaxID=153742 RepID=A0ABD2ZTZ0_9GENT